MANKDLNVPLYNGLHLATFKNSSHRYYIDGSLRPSVTTIMSKVLAKDGLMLWPLNMALKYIRENCSFTSHYQVTSEDLDLAATAHVKRRDAGADTGTIVHELAEQSLRAETIDIEKYKQNSDVMRAYNGFQSWCSLTKPEVIAVERLVYSHLHEYAGTFDSILKIDNVVYLCDLKTTNTSRTAPKGVYAEYFIQLGAYYYAYEEQRQYEIMHGGTDLVEIDDLLIISCRKDGKVDTVSAKQIGLTLKDCMDLWVNTLLLYKQLSRVKKELLL